MFLFTTTTCGHCVQLLNNQVVVDAIERGDVENTDLFSMDPIEREEIFKTYNPKRSVPFMVYQVGDDKFETVIGGDHILDIVSQL